MNNNSEVAIVAPQGATLGVVLHAALTAQGWTVALLPELPPDRNGSALSIMSRSPLVVIIEDDDGAVATELLTHPSLAGLICVGSIHSIGMLAQLASRGATVLNQAAPILVLLELVQQALLTPAARGPHPDGPPPCARPGELSRPGEPPRPGELSVLAELTQRQSEAERLARLSPAENQVLRGLVAGLTAAEMAIRSQHSVHTIRSQIKAVLSKLQVGTHVSAVAIAHRSGQYRWLHTALATFTNFGDDPTSAPSQP